MKKFFFIILLIVVIILSLIISCSEPSENHSFKSSGVKPVNVKGVTLEKTNVLMMKGWTEQLEASILPVDATNQTIQWSSNNNAIVEVSQVGIITAKTTGETIITVKTVEGSFTASCTVKVIEEAVPVESVELTPTTVTIDTDETVHLTATVLPSDATNTNIFWSSSNSAIASVSNTGLVTGNSAGEVDIIVTTVDGGYTASCRVKVTSDYVPVTGVKLNKTSIIEAPGYIQQLTATVLPINATNQTIEWSSNDHTVAIVSSTGEVTVKSLGIVEITVKTIDGNKTAICTITVDYLVGKLGPAGGYIFYDKGNNDDGWRFFEAAPDDLGSVWWSGVLEHIFPDADDSWPFGTGKDNTQYIISSGKGGPATTICSNFSLGGYSDWFLPSIDELNVMYNVLKVNGIGNFSNSEYWSSSEKDRDEALLYNFSSGDSYIKRNKDDSNLVRAVHRF